MYILRIVPLCGGLLLTGCVAVTTINNEENVQQIAQQTGLPWALASHDAATTFTAARKLALYEAKAKAVEKVYNSENMYNYAAVFAAGQGNVTLMRQIADAAPGTQGYLQQMTVTRGADTKAPAAIPQMVEVTFGGWDKLTPAQAPIWGDYIMAFYPQMNRAAAEIFANKVNSSRSMMAPALLAEVAVDLGKFDGNDVPAAFQAKNVFANAVDMAIFLNDKEAMEKIVALYDKASFKDAKTAKDLAAELKAMGKTRAVTVFGHTGGRGQMCFGPGGQMGWQYEGGRVSGTRYDDREGQAYMMLQAYR